MTALILFTRELIINLRKYGDALDEIGMPPMRGDVVRAIAGAVEAAAKKAFHL